MFFRPILGHRPSRDHNLLRKQPRRDFFIFEGMARIFLRHHFPNHLSYRNGRHHVGGLIRSLQTSIEEEFQLQHPLRAIHILVCCHTTDRRLVHPNILSHLLEHQRF